MNHAADPHNIVRPGHVAEVDAAAGKCRIASGDLLTDWLPWLAPAAGNVRTWRAPGEGEQVLLLAPAGDLAAAVVLCGLFSNDHPAPSASADEHLTEYPDGAQLRYDHAAHALTAHLPAGATVTITADGGITITGPVQIHGDVTIDGNVAIDGDADITGTATAAEDVVGGGKSLKSHRHTAVQTGSGVSGPPQ